MSGLELRLVSALCLGLVACAETETPSQPLAAGEPLYLVSTAVISGEELLGYLATATDIGPGSEYNLDRAIELDGAGWVFHRDGDVASVFVASRSAPTIVRWQVLDTGALVKRETLDLSNIGVESAYLAASAPIYSSTKSYFVDTAQRQLVIWNPARMQLIGTVALPGDDEGTLRPTAEGELLVQGDRVRITISWQDADNIIQLGEHVRLLTLDAERDEFIADEDHGDANHLRLSTRDSKGNGYYSPDAFYSAARTVAERAGASSIVRRVSEEGEAFDPDYNLDLSKLVGGRPAGDYTLLDDQTALIRVWHPELVDSINEQNWEDVLWGQAGFAWWRWHVGTDQAEPIDDEPAALGGRVFAIDDKTYTLKTSVDRDSTLVEITSEGRLIPGLKGPGQIVGPGVLRIR